MTKVMPRHLVAFSVGVPLIAGVVAAAFGASPELTLACVVGATVWLLISLFAFLVIALVDEDVNHWEWEGDDGPGLATNLRHVLYSALIATAVVGSAAFLFSIFWN